MNDTHVQILLDGWMDGWMIVWKVEGRVEKDDCDEKYIYDIVGYWAVGEITKLMMGERYLERYYYTIMTI
jgi:hypothetical protein